MGACLAIKTSKRNTRDGPGFLGPIKDANPLFFRLTVSPPAPARPPARPAPVVRLSFVSAPFLRFRRPMLLWRAALFALSFLPLSTLPTRELRSEDFIREHVSGFSLSELRSCFFTREHCSGLSTRSGFPMVDHHDHIYQYPHLRLFALFDFFNNHQPKVLQYSPAIIRLVGKVFCGRLSVADSLDPSTSMAIDPSIIPSPPQPGRRKRVRSKSQKCHSKRHSE